MKRLRLFSLLLALTLAAALFTGCGSSSGAAGDNGAMDQMTVGTGEAAEPQATGSADYATATEESQSDSGSPAAPRAGDAKLIYTGNLSLECTDLQTAMGGLEELVSAHGGYLERQEVYQQTGWQTADYTVRVPGDRYYAFLEAVESWEGGKVTYQSTTVDDVGEEYADIENRLETLQIKLDRLQNLLAQAENMEDIITIESAISDVEYEIEDLSGQKNRYDSLIDYSTVYITLQQVNTLSEGRGPEPGRTAVQRLYKGPWQLWPGLCRLPGLAGQQSDRGADLPGGGGRCGDPGGAPETPVEGRDKAGRARRERTEIKDNRSWQLAARTCFFRAAPVFPRCWGRTGRCRRSRSSPPGR